MVLDMKLKKDEPLRLGSFLLSVFALFATAIVLMVVISARGEITPISPDGTGGSADPLSSNETVSNNFSLPASCDILDQSSDQGEDYIKKIVFVGDSTTYHLIARGVLPGGTETTQVWGPSNGTLMLNPSVTSLKIVYPDTDTEMTIAEAAAMKKPEYIILTIGLNGSHTFTETLYKGSYRKLIEAIKAASPSTRIILQSVFPVASNENAWTSLSPAELNLCIDRVNVWARDLTAEYENVRYLDTQSVLRDEKGFLKDAYQAGDGIHLTAEGYKTILSYIRTHAWL